MDPFQPGRTTIGFVGIGKMGVPMSRNLRRGDFTVLGYDVRPEALEAVRADGVQAMASLAELALRADVVITMVPNSDVVDRVVLGPGGVAENLVAGKVVIDMSSSYPARTRALGEALAGKGIHLVGAPVSGGVIGAEAATLAIMPGGPKPLVEASIPIFEILGKTIVHMGEAVESGHAMKCINNFLSATNLLSSCEAMVMATKAGLDPQKALDVFLGGSGMNSAVRDKWPRFLLPRRFESGFTTGLMYKDLSMGCDMAREMGVTAFILNHVRQMFGMGVGRYGPDSDQTHMLEIIEEWAGQRVGAPSAAEGRN